MLTEIAYAKVNLALHVRRRRADGYHDIESLFAFARDGDVLHASPRDDGTVTLRISGPFAEGLSVGDDNLVLRAAHALKGPRHHGADLHLIKNLPVASGIGGGSADAAATLRLLDRLWDLRTLSDELAAIADPLGSDVPPCLFSRTLVGTGRGEKLDFRDLPELADCPMLLVNPGVPLSTAPVFAGWDKVDRGAMDAGSVDTLIREGRNDLEPAARALVPEIGAVLDALSALPHVRLARMSGSGATCFALFETHEAMAAGARQMTLSNPHWWMMETALR